MKKKSIANIGVAALLAVTLAGTSAPVIPMEVFANVSEPPAEGEETSAKTSKEILDEKTEAYEKAKALYEQARKSADDEAVVLAELEAAYEAAGLDADELYKAFEELRNQNIAEISGQIEELDKQIANDQAALDTAQADKDAAQEELDAKNAELTSLNEEISQVESALAAATDNTEAIDNTKADIQDLKDKKAAAEAKLTEVNSDLRDNNASLESVKADKASAESKIAEIKADKAVVESDIANKNEYLAQLKNELADNEDAIQATEDEISSLQSQLSILNAEYDKQSDIYSAAELEFERISDLQIEKSSLERQIEEAESNLEEAETELSQKIAELEANGTTMDNLYAEKASLESELAELNTQKAALEEEIANSDAEVAKTIENLEAQKAEYEASLEEAQSLLASVGIDYVDSINASYEKNVTPMTVKEYFDYMVANDTTLINSGATSEDNLPTLKSKYEAAFTYENLIHAMSIIDRANEVRQSDSIAQELAEQKGLDSAPILTVGVSGMKYTALEGAAYKVANQGHLLFRSSMDISNQDDAVSGGAAENLAAGYTDPVLGWYDKEIDAYREYYNGGSPTTQYGHAKNLLNPSYTVTSITFNGRESAQTLYNTNRTQYYVGYSTITITTDEFRAGLNSLKSEREATVSAITKSIEEIAAQITGLETGTIDPASETKAKLSDTNKAIEDKNAEINATQDKIDQATTDRTTLETEKSGLESSKAEYEKTISDLQTKLKDYVDVTDEAVEEAKQAMFDAYDELSETGEAIEATELQLDNAKSKLTDLQIESSDIRDKIEATNTEIAEFESQLAAITANELSVQNDIDSYASQIAELEAKISELTEQQTALKEEIEQHQSNIAKQESTLENLIATDSNRIQAELDELNSQLAEITAEYNNINERIANLTNTIETTTSALNAAAESKTSLDATLKILETQSITSGEFTGDLKDKADAYNAKIAEQEDLATQIADQKIIVATTEAEAQAAEGAMNQAEIEMDAARIIYESELGPQEAIRINGANRYATSLSTADALKKSQGVEKFQTIIVATGKNFADSLAGSYLAAVRGNAPIISIDPEAGNRQNNTIEYINANIADGGEVIILGGYNAVPESVDSRITAKVSRLAGASRYETNVMILEAAGVSSADELLVSTGTEFADSLSASATGKPILLVGKELTGVQNNFLEKYFKRNGKKITVLGGSKAVSDKVYNNLSSFGASMKRIAGNNRYDTSRLIANEYFGGAKYAVIAYGKNFPDGLAGGPLAMQLGAPLILANDSADVARMLSGYTSTYSINTGYILGGATLVTDEAVRIILECMEIAEWK